MLNLAKYAAVAALAVGPGLAATKPTSAWGYTWGYSCGGGCGYGYGAFGPFPYGFYPYGYDGYRPYHRTSSLPVLRPQAIHHRQGRHRGPPMRPAGRDRPGDPRHPDPGWPGQQLRSSSTTPGTVSSGWKIAFACGQYRGGPTGPGPAMTIRPCSMRWSSNA